MNKNALMSVLALNGENLGDLANVLGVNKSTISNKVSGRNSFTQNEINIMVHRYNLTPEQTYTIFFN